MEPINSEQPIPDYDKWIKKWKKKYPNTEAISREDFEYLCKAMKITQEEIDK